MVEAGPFDFTVYVSDPCVGVYELMTTFLYVEVINYVGEITGRVCVCLSLHPLGWAHSFWRFLGPQLGLHFFEFELKPTGKDSADPTQHEFQHHIV